MKVTVKTVGFADLERELYKLKGSTAKSNTRKAMKAALEPMAEMARQGAPVKGGDLRESIAVTSRVKPRQSKQSDLEMYMGPGRNPQAITQEFGTFFHAAHPYMRPAWEAEKMPTLDRFGGFMWDNVSKAVARAERKAARARK